MGRKATPIDLDELEKLAAMHCTQREVAAWFRVSQKTISVKLRQKAYAEVWECGWAKGNISLRRVQFNRAKAGDGTMLVWLGKQWLGQRDTQKVEHTGKEGAPIKHEHDFSHLSDEEIEAAIVREAESIAGRAAAAEPLGDASANAEAEGVS